MTLKTKLNPAASLYSAGWIKGVFPVLQTLLL